MYRNLFLLAVLVLPHLAFSQCTTTNATGCVCPNGASSCNLLPDIMVGPPPLYVWGAGGFVEYPGELRLSVSTPNIGYGPLEIRALPVAICGTDTFYNVPGSFSCPNGQPLKQLVVQRIFQKNGNVMNFLDRPAGSMTYHPTHGHMHVDDWGVYSLRIPTSDPNPLNWPVVGNGSKLAFCLMDYGSCSTYNGHCVDSIGNVLTNGNFPNFGLGGGQYGCSPVVQGISAGYTDIYYQSLDGMFITIPPGLCNGTYWVVVQLDPYNYFLESNETNNVFAVPVTLTRQGGSPTVVTTNGPTTFCSGTNITLTAASATNYLWSNGATSRSITISQPGTYTVTTNTTSNCPSTSAPITVSLTPLPVTASASPAAICTGGSAQLSVISNGSSSLSDSVTFSNPTGAVIPDNDVNGVSSLISVSGISPSSLNPGSILSVVVNITHPHTGDLLVELISPSMNSTILSNRRGGAGANFINTNFITGAGQSISMGTAPFTGIYVPDGSFSSLTGNMNGTWMLRVSDRQGNYVGTLNNWSLTLLDSQNANMTYSWSSNPAGFSSNSPNPVVNPSVNTTYTVIVTDTNTGCTGSQSVNVTLGNSINVTTNPTVSLCAGDSTMLTATGAMNYTWFPATGLSSTTGASVRARPSSTTTYRVIGSSGGCLDTAFVTITVNNLPASATGMTGPTKACPGSSFNYSCPPIAGATGYNWTLPANATIISGQNTANITVSYNSGFTGGLLTVTGQNACGAGGSFARNIVRDMPLPPSTISGKASGTCAKQETYSVSSAPGTSINWTVPSGATITGGQSTPNAVISFSNNFTGGNISVTAHNTCGNSAPRTLNIKGAPADPSTISGPAVVCQGQKNVQYTAGAAYGASNYSWMMPKGITVASGQGTNNTLLNYAYNASSTKFRVKAANSCGSSFGAGFYVKVNDCSKYGSLESNEPGTVRIIPNPAIGYTEVHFESSTQEQLELTLVNMLGQQVYRKMITTTEGGNMTRIDLRQLRSGVYVISLVRNNGTFTERLVIE